MQIGSDNISSKLPAHLIANDRPERRWCAVRCGQWVRRPVTMMDLSWGVLTTQGRRTPRPSVGADPVMLGHHAPDGGPARHSRNAINLAAAIRPGRDAAPSNRTTEVARAPRGYVPATRIISPQIVSDNLHQGSGPPCRSPTAVPSPRIGPSDRSATCPRTSPGLPVGFSFPNCCHAEPAGREGQGCSAKSGAFPPHFPRGPQTWSRSPPVIPSQLLGGSV